jgi:hypothetical protein
VRRVFPNESQLASLGIPLCRIVRHLRVALQSYGLNWDSPLPTGLDGRVSACLAFLAYLALALRHNDERTVMAPFVLKFKVWHSIFMSSLCPFAHALSRSFPVITRCTTRSTLPTALLTLTSISHSTILWLSLTPTLSFSLNFAAHPRG